MFKNLIILFYIISVISCTTYKERIANKEFWEILQLKAILNPKTTYNAFEGETICISCPINKESYLKLYDTAMLSSNTGPVYESLLNPHLNRDPPKPLPIIWSLPNMKALCDNNVKLLYDINRDNYKNTTLSKFDLKPDFSCDNNQLCLSNVKIGLPEKYFCHIGGQKMKADINIRGKIKILLIKRKHY